MVASGGEKTVLDLELQAAVVSYPHGVLNSATDRVCPPPPGEAFCGVSWVCLCCIQKQNAPYIVKLPGTDNFSLLTAPWVSSELVCVFPKAYYSPSG